MISHVLKQVDVHTCDKNMFQHVFWIFACVHIHKYISRSFGGLI